jgi:hypothetical protein
MLFYEPVQQKQLDYNYWVRVMRHKLLRGNTRHLGPERHAHLYSLMKSSLEP